jgi:tetratricopeptide (TPR) repeat protein
MGSFSPEDAVLRWAAGLYWRLLRLSRRKPFLLSPSYWGLGLFIAIAIGFACVLVDAAFPVLLLPIALFVLSISGSAGWRYLKKSSDNPIVFFSRFNSSTASAQDAAIEHLKALGERLRDEPSLVARFDLREIPEVLTEDQARLLLEEGPASAVVYGEVRTGGDVARWELDMLLSWRLGDGFITNVRTVGPKELTAQAFSRSQAPAPLHEQFVDADQPLRKLAAERFESNHVDRIVGTLLVLAGTSARPDAREMKRCFEAAAPYRSVLSPQARGAIEVNSAFAEDEGSLPQLFGHLQRAAEGDADHVELWNTLVSISFLRYLAGEISAADHVKTAMRAVESDPTNAMAHYNLGEAYMSNAEVDAGLTEFESLVDDPEYSTRPYLHMGIGVIHYNHTKQFADARDAYQRAVNLQSSPQAHLYLADSHRVLKEYKPALEHYRQALLLDRELIDAHRGYWGTMRESEQTQEEGLWDSLVRMTAPSNLRVRRLLRPLNRKLLLWRLGHHPEDSRIHYMLGAQSLLIQDYANAERRLIYANDLSDGHDLEAQARLAVVRGLQGRISEAESLLEGIRSAQPPPASDGGLDFSTKAGKIMSILLPFLDEPRLSFLPHAEDLREAMERVFGPLSKSTA